MPHKLPKNDRKIRFVNSEVVSLNFFKISVVDFAFFKN